MFRLRTAESACDVKGNMANIVTGWEFNGLILDLLKKLVTETKKKKKCGEIGSRLNKVTLYEFGVVIIENYVHQLSGN